MRRQSFHQQQVLRSYSAEPRRYYQLTDAELNQVTPAQLAIDGKVKHSKIPDPRLSLKIEADRPDLLGFQRWFRPDKAPLFHGTTGRSVDDGLPDGVRSTTRLLSRGMAAITMWGLVIETAGPGADCPGCSGWEQETEVR